MELPVLLITSAIKPDKVSYLKMSDSDKRLEATINGIKRWKTQYPDLKIVVVDGTNFDLSPYIPDDIESLFFHHDSSLVEQLGKGAGEAQDIEYALRKSSLIKNGNYFMKVTGKYWVENLEKFKSEDLFTNFKCKPIISNTLSLKYINTAFFCSNKDAYLKIFKNLPYEVNDNHNPEESNSDLEHIMAISIKKNNLRNYIFSEIPMVAGWTGTGDHMIELYKDRKKHFFRNLKYKILSHIF